MCREFRGRMPHPKAAGSPHISAPSREWMRRITNCAAAKSSASAGRRGELSLSSASDDPQFVPHFNASCAFASAAAAGTIRMKPAPLGSSSRRCQKQPANDAAARHESRRRACPGNEQRRTWLAYVLGVLQPFSQPQLGRSVSRQSNCLEMSVGDTNSPPDAAASIVVPRHRRIVELECPVDFGDERGVDCHHRRQREQAHPRARARSA